MTKMLFLVFFKVQFLETFNDVGWVMILCVCVCIYVYIYIYFGSISSLIQISLNIIDIFCLHIFLLIHSYCRIAFIVFGRN